MRLRLLGTGASDGWRAPSAVLYDVTAPDGVRHLDLEAWPEQVARLREAGAVDHRTRLLAVLGHDNPPPRELDEQLAGAVAPRDGAVLELAAR